MKTKVFNVLAAIKFEVLEYAIKVHQCRTLGDLVDDLCFAYSPEDVNRIADDLEYSFNNQ